MFPFLERWSASLSVALGRLTIFQQERITAAVTRTVDEEVNKQPQILSCGKET